MSGFEVTVSNVIFIIDAENKEEAISKAKHHLSEIAHDWGAVST